MQANQPNTLTGTRLGMLLGAAVAFDAALYNWPKYVAAALLLPFLYILLMKYVDWVHARQRTVWQEVTAAAPFALMLGLIFLLTH